MFRKSLFRVTNAKKYYYHDLYDEEKNQQKSASDEKIKGATSKLRDIEAKMQEELEENKRAYE